MPPSTRSGGVPAPERVYHSTPSLHQMRFPARRAVVKTYGKKTRKPVATNQSTLTQLNWVSSSSAENAAVEFSDSEEEKDKENEEDEEDEDEDEDEEPVTGGRRQRRQAAKQTFFEDDPPSAGKRRRGSSAAVQESESKSKRRRTLGDEIPQNARRAPSRGSTAEKGRRKTMDDMPSPEDSKKKKSKMYHTQTITQVVRGFNHHVIGDSEDEDDEGQEGRDGFDEWVGAPSPSPKKQKQQPPQRPDPEDQAPSELREESVVPQTPAKKQIRFEIPSSTQSSKSHLSARALERYGPVDQPQVTPSKGGSSAKMEQIAELPGDASARKTKPASARKLVIEDSFAEDSWGSTQSRRSPLKDVTAAHVPMDAVQEEEEQGEDEQENGDEQITPRATPRPSSSLSKESSSVEEAMSTPSKPPHRTRSGSKDLGRDSPSPQRAPRPQQASAPASVPGKKDLHNVFEIPDSEEEDEEDGDDDYWGEEQVKTQDKQSNQTQEEPAEEPKPGTQLENAPADESAAPEQHETGGSEESTRAAPTQNQDTFILGAETQGAFDELTINLDTTPKARAPLSTLPEEEEERIPQSTAASQSDRHISQSPVVPRRSTRSRTSSQHSPLPAPKLPSPPKAAKPIRRPIHYPGLPSSPTQLIESQRVPLSIIQGLGEVSALTDSFVIVPAAQLEQLASGHRVTLTLDHTLPSDVVRLWLFGNGLLRYAACVGLSHEDRPGQWTFDVTQMYELNNPLDQPDIEAEEWFNRFPTRWAKLPPAIVSQLLSNLKHALFNTDETQGTTQQLPPPPSSPLPPRAKTPSASFSSASVSQQVEAQLRSETEQHTQCLPSLPSDNDDILVPSTPVHPKSKKTPRTAPPPPPPAFTPRLPSSTAQRPSTNKTPRFVQSSQATTASQASTDEHHSIPQPSTSRRNTLPPPPTPISRPPPLPESSSLHFVDLDSPENPRTNTGSGDNIPISQLLTKSQMLSDSLLADDVNMPPKLDMWASDEEA